ncbi:hypothetical protein [Gordonia spumicola]|uniref:hypothetical protein n=1 Tax=Gordonia spumicola TaxID=589161 RepID=UPI001379CAC5|nr:hypothetical protein [Gordonia spumicola]
MKIRNFVAVAVVAAAVATTAACGSDDNSNLPPVPTAASSSAAESSAPASNAQDDEMTNPNKVPSVAALNDMLTKALDPNVKAADKIDLVEDAQKDPGIFDALVKAKKENPKVTYRIKAPVTKNGPKKAKVKVVVKVPGNPANPIDASIVFDNGRWKLSKQTVCPLLAMADMKSPLCPTTSATTSKKKNG